MAVPNLASPAAAPPCRILLVEDDEGDAGLIRWALRKQVELAYQLEHVETLEACLEACTRSLFDVILLDLHLPGTVGLEAIATVVRTCPGPAIVVVTGLDDADSGLEAVQAGAEDYLVKQRLNPHELCRAIRYALERKASRDYLVRLREEFLAHVSHELRTPLTAAIGALELLRDGDTGSLEESQARFIDMARGNLRLLRSMVGDLIDTTILRTGKLTVQIMPTTLADLVLPVVASMTPLASQAGITLQAAVHAPRALVAADPDRVHQVLTNLISNAIKYTPPDGTIAVETSGSSDGGATVTVRDSGCGIGPAVLPHLFDRLYQAPDQIAPRSRNGLGLGLYISRELISAHGGQIWAESTVGHGSRFAFTLPAAATTG